LGVNNSIPDLQLSSDVISGLIHGDIDAFRTIYDIFFKKVFHFVCRLSLSAEDAEEITQDVFVKLWEKRSSVLIDRNLNSFLYKIAQNMIIDKYRQYAAHECRLRKIINSDKTKIVNTSATEQLVNYYELSGIITCLIDDLPKGRRTIFKLNREKGLTYKEIAEILKISQGTVEKQISKALHTLKTALKVKYGILIDLVILLPIMYFWHHPII
jgi:RNA polymerase sigma-70 factor (ECF subfamily)